MNELVYCIECGRMEEMKCYPVWGCSHDVTLPLFGDMGEIVGTDHDLCYFPAGYAFVLPPEIEEDWEYNVDAPGDDELLVMDLQALVGV